MNIRNNIPNAITCGNLFCGCLSILEALKGNLAESIYLVFLAILLDFLDGLAARMLNARSPLGAQLDSLADMVTFGVVPGIIMFQMMNLAGISAPVNLLSFVLTIFSAIRLAKFNIDTRQTDSFIGLPTPANTFFIISLLLLVIKKPDLYALILQPSVLIGITLSFSYLMIAEIPMFSLKFKDLSWSGNRLQFIFLGGSLLMLVTFFYIALPAIIILYVVLSVVNSFIKT
jgi:CDP-diacylglycerol---serine O-phosphatidyltransferase